MTNAVFNIEAAYKQGIISFEQAMQLANTSAMQAPDTPAAKKPGYMHGRKVRPREDCTRTKSARAIESNARKACGMSKVEFAYNGSYLWIFALEHCRADEFGALKQKLSKRWKYTAGTESKDAGYYYNFASKN